MFASVATVGADPLTAARSAAGVACACAPPTADAGFRGRHEDIVHKCHRALSESTAAQSWSPAPFQRWTAPPRPPWGLVLAYRVHARAPRRAHVGARSATRPPCTTRSHVAWCAALRWREGGAALTRGTEDCRQPAGETISQTRRTVDEAAPELVDGMRDGSIVNRSRRPYKPAAVRSYERALQMRLLPVFGSRRLAEVKAGDVQRFPEALLRDGLNASSARTTLHPLRVIYRRAVRLGGSATTRRRRSSCRPRRVGAGAWSRRRGRWHSSSRWPPASRHSGRLRCSSGCAAASFAPSDGPTSSSQPAP